ncbi:hypothetical protein P5V15_011045 [Pogonomyrmex californicus]
MLPFEELSSLSIVRDDFTSAKRAQLQFFTLKDHLARLKNNALSCNQYQFAHEEIEQFHTHKTSAMIVKRLLKYKFKDVQYIVTLLNMYSNYLALYILCTKNVTITFHK